MASTLGMNVMSPKRTSEEPALLRLNAAQLRTMAEAGVFSGDSKVELRGGLLYEMAPEHAPHMRAESRLFLALANALGAVGSPFEASVVGSVKLGEGEVPQPDLIVWNPADERGAVPVERVRLLVEVSSGTLAEDLGRKRGLYAAASVPEYWVVDVSGRAIHQYWAPADGAYARSALVPFGEAVRSATLAGLVVPTVALDRG